MLPKKLFTPKCLHADRDTVFHEDLGNFFHFVISEMSDNINKTEIKISNEEISNKIFSKDSMILNSIPDSNEEILKKKIKKSQKAIINPEVEKTRLIIEILNYENFKYFWKIQKMSMLHFTKSKEENSKEFYEVLFGEVQDFLLNGHVKNPLLSRIIRILAFYSLYSIYYTQTSEYFYQINTTPEVLAEINHILSENSHEVNGVNYTRVKKEIALMTKRLYQDDAFSIGTLVGIKTIILNKYGLPLEQRSNVYRDYVDINNTKILLEKMKFEEKEKNIANSLNLDEYVNVKRDTVNLMKNLNLSNSSFNTRLYCDFINEKMKNSNLAKEFHNNNNNLNENNILISDLTFFPHDVDMLNIKNEDFERNRITNLDLQFNQIENNL